MSNNLVYHVIDNNFDKVKNNIRDGETIYASEYLCTKVCSKICAYSDNAKNHNTCKTDCYKTAVYYCILTNARIYRTIYKCISKQKNNELENYLSTIDCVLFDIQEYCKGYQETYMNFKEINNVIGRLLKTIKSKCKNIQLEPIKKCIIHKNEIKNEINDKTCENNIIFNNFAELIEYYKSNIKIFELLINQQAYELIQYMCINKLNSFENIYVHDSKYVTINYFNEHNNMTILMNIIHNNIDIDIIKLLIDTPKIDINLKSKSNNWNLLMFIIKSNKNKDEIEEITKTIIKEIDINVCDDENVPIIIHAIIENLYNVAKIIYNELEKRNIGHNNGHNYFPLVRLYLNKQYNENNKSCKKSVFVKKSSSFCECSKSHNNKQVDSNQLQSLTDINYTNGYEDYIDDSITENISSENISEAITQDIYIDKGIYIIFLITYIVIKSLKKHHVKKNHNKKMQEYANNFM